MKIRFEGLIVKDLMQIGSSPSQKIVIRIFVSNAEMITAPTIYPGTSVTFPDIYEFGIDDVLFVAEMLNLEIEVVNVDNAANEIVIGKASGNLRQLLPSFDQEIMMALPLQLPDKEEFKGEIVLKAVVTEMETALVELKEKYFEEERLRNAYNELVTATKAMEDEMEQNMSKAQAQVDKVTKKYNALVEKYNELQDKFMTISIESEKFQSELIIERTEMTKIQKSTDDSVRVYRELNDELTEKVAELTQENEHINNKLRIATEESAVIQLELDELYSSKYETEMELNQKVTDLTEELEQLRQSTVSISIMEEMNEKIQQLVVEINRLRVLSVNNSVNCNNQFVNNVYIENIVNNINNTNIYVTNVLESDDLQFVRNEFINLLRRYDDVREREARLMNRQYDLVHGVQVIGRTRPPSEEEKQSSSMVVESTGELPEINIFNNNDQEWSTYQLDGHYAYEATQQDMFGEVDPLVTVLVPDPLALQQNPGLAAARHNVAVLAYGGPTSGKTFTVFGFGDQPGLAFRAIQRLYAQLDFRSTQLIKEKSRVAALAVTEEQQRDNPVNDLLFEYEVSLSIVEVTGNSLFDLVQKGDINNDQVVFDAETAWVQLPASTRTSVKDVDSALNCLKSAVTAAMDRKRESSSVFVEVHLSVRFNAEEKPVISRILLADLLDSVPVEGDQSVLALEGVLTALAEGREAQYDSSLLTKALRGALAPETRTMFFFGFAPMDTQFDVTKHNAELASKLRSIRREVKPKATGGGGADPAAVRAVERKLKSVTAELKSVTTELREQKQKTVIVEETLVETKSVAEEYIVQFNARNKIVTKHFEEEKRLNQQLQSDLELTLRNLRKAVAELSEQRTVNEKLAGLCRLLERERQANAVAATGSPVAAAN